MGKKVFYPGELRLQRISANDPPGTHLVVVVAARQPQSLVELRGRTEAQLAHLATYDWSLPPSSGNGMWLNASTDLSQPADWQRRISTKGQVRGAGGTVESATPRAYLREVERSLPPNMVPLAAVFLEAGNQSSQN
jgi:hypothetical protein